MNHPPITSDTNHHWVMFQAPQHPKGPYTSNEPYYVDLTRHLSTWTRPFDYIHRSDAGEYAQKLLEEHRQKCVLMARQRAQQDRPRRKIKTLGDWTVVETVQGREYYYNEVEGRATWEKPVEVEEIENRADGTEMDAEDAEWMMQMMEQEGEAEEPEELEEPEEPEEPVVQMLPKEKAVELFRQMLRDHPIDVFGTWEAHIPKLHNDQRFHYIQDALERQELFDQVAADLVREKKTKRQEQTRLDELPKTHKKQKTSDEIVDPFDELLAQHVRKKTSFARFCQKHLKDPRYLSVKTSREREKRFLKHVERLGK